MARCPLISLARWLVVCPAMGAMACGPAPAVKSPAAQAVAPVVRETGAPPAGPPRKDLSELLEPPPAATPSRPSTARPTLDAPDLLANIDERKVAAEGIRRVTGRRLVLYTDLPARREIEELPALFDQAFPQWCAFFGVDPSKAADWQAVGCLMSDKTRFERAGLLPNALPPFAHGYSVGRCLWLYDQTSPYYRRHLLLHEGVHAFMDTVLRAGGPPWYVEGLAELLGTHRWQNNKLELGTFPASAEDAPRLGRVEMIQKALAAGKTLNLDQVLAFGPRAHLEVEPYAWCWAAATLLDRSTDTRGAFREIVRAAQADRVPRDLAALDPRGDLQLAERWQLFVTDLDYGYDFERMRTDLRPATGEFVSAPRQVSVRADRGWQNSGLRVEAGKHYRIAARGRFQIAAERDAAAGKPEVWWSEPGGVTLRYYRGRPLGELLAAILPDDFSVDRELIPLAQPQPVGLGGEFTPPRAGTLFFKINDAPGELADNAGEVEVEVSPAP